MRNSLRCGALTRSGKECENPAVKGKIRCRMHGGGAGSGGRIGNTNALKDGAFTRQSLDERKEISKIIRDGREIILQMASLNDEDEG
jgi:hypothetical protein